MTMRRQGWGTSGVQGRVWEVMTGMEFILEHLEDWRVLYDEEPAHLAAESGHTSQREEPELAMGVKSISAQKGTTTVC
jgi:hypothetical protein